MAIIVEYDVASGRWIVNDGTSSNAYTPGGTDVAVADGGTGSSTAAGARSNLDVPGKTDLTNNFLLMGA